MFESTKSLQNVHERIYEFAGQAREEAPELVGLEGQILSLFTIVMKKTATAALRSEGEVDEMVADLNDIWAKGLEPGSRLWMRVVTGQRVDEQDV